MAEEIIAVGKKCTIYPDNQVEYEIIEVKSKTIKIVLENKTAELTQYYVDLKEIENPLKIIKDLPIEHINLINE